MSELKLTYFDAPGRAEMCRLALFLGDIPFDDERLSFASWPAFKPSTPYGSMPTLSIDGTLYAQSNAILRYCGARAALYPSDPLRALQADELLDAVGDLSACFGRGRGEGEERVREERAKFVSDDLPRYLGGIDKRIEILGNGTYAVGDQLSVADLAVYALVLMLKSGFLDHVPADCADQYPNAVKCYETVKDHPKVVEWYKKRAEAQE